MLHRLILKVTKLQLPLSKRLSTVVKNIFGGGVSCPPMSNRVNFISLSKKKDNRKMLYCSENSSAELTLENWLKNSMHKVIRWFWWERSQGHSKITWVGTSLIEGCNRRKPFYCLFIEMECILLRFLTYVIGSSLEEIVKIENTRISN